MPLIQGWPIASVNHGNGELSTALLVQNAIKLCDTEANDNVTIGETSLCEHATRQDRVNGKDLLVFVATSNKRRAVFKS